MSRDYQQDKEDGKRRLVPHHGLYEQLGVPTLVYRNKSYHNFIGKTASPWGCSADAPDTIKDTLQVLNRVRARWYYPCLDPYLVDRLYAKHPEEAVHLKEKILRKRQQRSRQETNGKGGPADNDDDKLPKESSKEALEVEKTADESEVGWNKKMAATNEDGGSSSGRLGLTEQDSTEGKNNEISGDDNEEENKELETEHIIKRLKKMDDEMMKPIERDAHHSRSIVPLDEARALMLRERHGRGYLWNRRGAIESYRRYDHPYITRDGYRFSYEKYGEKRTVAKLGRPRLACHSLFVKERKNHADPAYLAPFGTESLEYAANDDSFANEREEIYVSNGVASRASSFGNAMLCIRCPCPICNSKENRQHASANLCLFHPTGPLLDRLNFSAIILPKRRDTKLHRRSLKRHLLRYVRENDMGDEIQQICECGAWDGKCSSVVAIRTSLHVTILDVRAFGEERYSGMINRHHLWDQTRECWGQYDVIEKHRIDLRTLYRHDPSYKPIDMTCHPKYGNAFVGPKLAVLVQSSRKECNIIYHVNVNMAAPDKTRITKHTISCLQRISKIDFDCSHPRRLWAAATSYVRPTLSKPRVFDTPIVGHGYSLYNIDLCTNDATFQWSPSAERCAVEGVHSISGIMTDWNKENVVWVSSTSAGMTWEIDAREPCRVLNSWSLPGTCDEGSPTMPATSLYGSGTLLVQPPPKPSSGDTNDARTTDWPILAVDKSPGAFGLHLYQRPETRPRFQTQNLECAACPGLDSIGVKCIATSSVYALPDVSDEVFTCGLATFRRPLSEWLSEEAIEQLGYTASDSVLCAMTLTRNGDIYCHALVESRGETKRCQTFADLPVGASMVVVPEIDGNDSVKQEYNICGRLNLLLSLSNVFPCPSIALMAPREDARAFKAVHRKRMYVNLRRDERKLRRNIKTRDDDDEAKIPHTQPRAVFPRSHDGKPKNEVKELSLPSKFVAEARTDAANFKNIFEDRSAMVEEDTSDSDQSGEVMHRSDVTADLLEVSKAMWDKL